ncbi:MAG: hypothetical protein IJC88_01915 [Oscillospiraceae bacterium]|nr:hypothetical protein [Oscillospiraceae bacterium]
MKQKKRSVKAAIIFLVGLVLVGVFAIAAEYGTSADPLVSQSYIDSVFTPKLIAQVNTLISQKVSGVSTQIQSAQSTIDQKIAEFESRQLSVNMNQAFYDQVSNRLIQNVQDQTANNSTFKAVSLSSGQKLILTVGAEVLLQSGSASCVTNLLDSTTGASLGNGGAVQRYHMYLAPVQNCGITATSGTTLLVRGYYQVK